MAGHPTFKCIIAWTPTLVEAKKQKKVIMFKTDSFGGNPKVEMKPHEYHFDQRHKNQT